MLKLKNGREVLFSGRVDNADVPWITNRIKSVVEVCHSIHSMPSFDKSHSLKSSCWSCSLLSLLACDVWRERKGSGPSRRYMRLQQVAADSQACARHLALQRSRYNQQKRKEYSNCKLYVSSSHVQAALKLASAVSSHCEVLFAQGEIQHSCIDWELLACAGPAEAGTSCALRREGQPCSAPC